MHATACRRPAGAAATSSSVLPRAIFPELPANRLLLKEMAAKGVFWGAFTAREPATNAANFAQLAAWYDAGRFKPVISQTYALDQAPQALQDLLDRKVTGKVVLVP